MVKKIMLLSLAALALPRQAASMNIDSRTLIETREELNLNPCALHDACNNGDLEKVKLLIKAGADVNALKPFKFSASHPEDSPFYVLPPLNVQGIPHFGIDFERQVSPLHISAKGGFKEISKFLIDNGALVSRGDNTTGKHPLHLAADENRVEIARLLLEEKASVDPCDITEHTPLYTAILKESDAMVTLLLEYNADISKNNIMGLTPLHVAATWGYKNILERLITESFFLPGFDKKKHASFPTLKRHCLKFLLENLKDYNFLKNNFLKLEEWSSDYIAELTPLDVQREIVKAWKEQKDNDQFDTLLHAHCNRHLSLLNLCLSIRDIAGDTPQELAQKKNYQETEELLSHVSRSKSLSDLKESLKEKIRNNIMKKIV